jgi:hypothetical protein
MRLITLHDHINPATEIAVDADSITAVTVFGSGSAVQCDQGVIGVHETMHEVIEAIRQ